MPRREAAFVDANGLRTYHERHGDGPPVLLLHGAGMVAEGWRPLIEALAAEFSLFVPERRGVGRTPDVPGPWSYAGMADDTAAFMAGVGLSRAHVIGLSDGGNVGLILAAEPPEWLGR